MAVEFGVTRDLRRLPCISMRCAGEVRISPVDMVDSGIASARLPNINSSGAANQRYATASVKSTCSAGRMTIAAAVFFPGAAMTRSLTRLQMGEGQVNLNELRILLRSVTPSR